MGERLKRRGGGGVGFGGHNMKGTVFVGICEVLYSKGDNRFQR